MHVSVWMLNSYRRWNARDSREWVLQWGMLENEYYSRKEEHNGKVGESSAKWIVHFLGILSTSRLILEPEHERGTECSSSREVRPSDRHSPHFWSFHRFSARISRWPEHCEQPEPAGSPPWISAWYNRLSMTRIKYIQYVKEQKYNRKHCT